jgi:hypothetical protein
MAKTATPIFVQTPKNNWAKVTGVDSSTDGTDADVVLLYTSNATDGGFIQRIVTRPISTSGSTTTSAAALRVYLNNGSAVGTAGNNILIAEYSLPAIAVNTTATTAPAVAEIPVNIALEAGFRLYVGVTAMAANTQWNFVAVAADYA